MKFFFGNFRYLYFPLAILLLCLVATRNVFISSKITVSNTIDVPIFIALYSHKSLYGFECKRISEVFTINPGETVFIKRSPYVLGYRRKLIFSRVQERLYPALDAHQYEQMQDANIGRDQGHIFYINLRDNTLNAQSPFERFALDPFIEKFRALRRRLLWAIFEQVEHIFSYDEHGHETAHIRKGSSLAHEEEEFLLRRHARVKPALEALLGMSLEGKDAPRIGLCFSGGGYRAMSGTIGFLIGASEIGLLDSATYLAALSGSSWAIAPWIMSAKQPHDYREHVIPAIEKNFLLIIPHLSHIILKRIEKFFFNQPFSWPYELLGAKFNRYFLQNHSYQDGKNVLSEFKNRVADASYPLPIFTMTEISTPLAEWIEATPYEVGGDFFGGYVPTWSFGRRFVNGVSQDHAPEPSLGFLLAVLGSAPSGKILQGLRLLKSKSAALIADALEKSHRKNFRLFNPIQFQNFTYGYVHSPLENSKLLSITDSGLDINLPLPPLLKKERNVDVIICFDMGNLIEDGVEFKAAEDYAKRKGLKFPRIDAKANYIANTINIIQDSTNNAPVIVHFPLVKNEKYSQNFDPQAKLFDKNSYLYINKWQHTKEQVLELSNLCRANIVHNKDRLVAVLREVALKKQKERLSA